MSRDPADRWAWPAWTHSEQRLGAGAGLSHPIPQGTQGLAAARWACGAGQGVGQAPMGLWGAWGPLWPWAVGLVATLTKWRKPLGRGSGVLLWCGPRMDGCVLQPWVPSLPSSLRHCVCLEPGLGAGTPRATSVGTGEGQARQPLSPTLHRAQPGLTLTRRPHPVLWAPHSAFGGPEEQPVLGDGALL